MKEEMAFQTHKKNQTIDFDDETKKSASEFNIEKDSARKGIFDKIMDFTNIKIGNIFKAESGGSPLMKGD